MTQQKPPYETDADDALEMLGKGYEVHPPAIVLEMRGDYRLEKKESKAWIKIDVGFRDVMKVIKGAQLSVFIAISLRINKDGECYPSFDTIAEDTGYSLRAVKTAAKELNDAGFLTIFKGDRPSNMYHINAFAAFGESDPHSAKIAPSAKYDAGECKKEQGLMSEIALKEEPINKNHKENKKPSFFDLTGDHKTIQKIKEIDGMIEKVKRVTGWNVDVASAKGERTVKRLIALEKDGGGDLEQFWHWNTSDEQKYDCLRYGAFAKDNTLLAKWVEDRAGDYLEEQTATAHKMDENGMIIEVRHA